MPYCTSCGKEIPEGKNFCTECGALVEPVDKYPGIPPEEQPLVVPLPFSERLEKKLPKKIYLVAAVIVMIALVAVYVIGLPMLTGPGPSSAMTPVPTPWPTMTTPVTSFVTSSTPLPVTSASIMEPEEEFTWEITPTPEPTFEKIIQADEVSDTYAEIYHHERGYEFGAKEIVSCNLTTPPLYIRFNLIPRMIERDILVNIGTSAEHMVNSTFPDPNAWFEVSVINIHGGSVVDSRGFNREYSATTEQEFLIRTPGDYRVEISGNGVTADVQVLTGKS